MFRIINWQIVAKWNNGGGSFHLNVSSVATVGGQRDHRGTRCGMGIGIFYVKIMNNALRWAPCTYRPNTYRSVSGNIEDSKNKEKNKKKYDKMLEAIHVWSSIW